MPTPVIIPDLSSRHFKTTAEKVMLLPVHDIFKAWTEKMDAWFAAPGTVIMKPEINSPFFFETLFEGHHHAHYGRFLKIELDQLVEMTWVTTGTLGAETVVTVELTSMRDRTRVHLTHAGFPDEKTKKMHEQAWPLVLTQLEERLLSRRT